MTTTIDQRERALLRDLHNAINHAHRSGEDGEAWGNYEPSVAYERVKAALTAPPHVPQDTHPLTEVREALEKAIRYCDGNANSAGHGKYERDLLKKALATLDRVIEGDGWLPIESAPRDGTLMLCYLPYNGGFITQTYWHVDGREGVWFDESGEICPTHWRPLPTPPGTK
jgi:hypothetical protein